MFPLFRVKDTRRRQVIRGLKAFHRANRPVNPCNKSENLASSRMIPRACAQPSQVKVSFGCNIGGDRAEQPPFKETSINPLLARRSGLSLHAATHCEADNDLPLLDGSGYSHC